MMAVTVIIFGRTALDRAFHDGVLKILPRQRAACGLTQGSTRRAHGEIASSITTTQVSAAPPARANEADDDARPTGEAEPPHHPEPPTMQNGSDSITRSWFRQCRKLSDRAAGR